MTHQQLWSEYVKSAGIDPATPYDPWQYGGSDPDGLLRLTLDGVKTATASVYDIYAIETARCHRMAATALFWTLRTMPAALYEP